MPRSRSNSAEPGTATPASTSPPSRSLQVQSAQASPPASPADRPHVVITGEQLTRLSAHAAVRFDELDDKLFDRDDLPKAATGKSRTKHRAFAQTVRKMASFMTTRINPSFQESQIKIEETLEGLYFTVYATTNPPKSTFRARLSTLVDVASDSVIEKETVVFTEAPGSDKGQRPSLGMSRASGNSGNPPATTSSSSTRKGELFSNFIRAYGDIGLLLTFRASRRGPEPGKRSNRRHQRSGNSSNAPPSRRPFTRISMRFVSTSDRDEWLSFCLDAYVGLLLDSIRTGVDQTQRDDAAPNPVFAAPIAPPSRDAVDKYVEFFLSAGGGEDVGGDAVGTPDDDAKMDYKTPPGGGLVKVSRVGEVGQLRRVTMEKKGRNHRNCLVMHRTSTRQRWRGVKRFTAPVASISVFADDEETGTNFFVECDRGGERAGGSQSAPSSATAVLWPRASVSTYEIVAKNHAARTSWLKWMELVTGKPVVYFSQNQQEPDANAQDEERKAQLFRMDELW